MNRSWAVYWVFSSAGYNLSVCILVVNQHFNWKHQLLHLVLHFLSLSAQLMIIWLSGPPWSNPNCFLENQEKTSDPCNQFQHRPSLVPGISQQPPVLVQTAQLEWILTTFGVGCSSGFKRNSFPPTLLNSSQFLRFLGPLLFESTVCVCVCMHVCRRLCRVCSDTRVEQPSNYQSLPRVLPEQNTK